ncbi:MAG: response regulator [Deltaproteobacteria bacterium]|nr:response regulator [Deltaproteobacteria bacterium]
MSETAETRVVAVLDDIFFASKIKEAAKSTGVNVEILKNTNGLIESLTSAPPTLIIVDLNSKKFNALDLIEELKSSQKLKNISTLGYLPHVQEELKKEAIEAGFDIVMPRSRFSRELKQILKEYNT